MKEYDKIKTLYKRDEKFKVTNELSMAEFAIPANWYVAEKIHGQNIRIDWCNSKVTFGTRTAVGDIPKELAEFLLPIFTQEKMQEYFSDEPVTLFGEGYGAGINKGGDLSTTKRFMLFDVFIPARPIQGDQMRDYWLSIPDVDKCAEFFGCDKQPWIATDLTLEEITDRVQRGILSRIAIQNTGKEVKSEGVVCRTHPEMWTRYGERLMFKLKTKDFK